MSNSNIKKEKTILTTWKGIVYEIEDLSIEDYLRMKCSVIEKGEDGFFSEKYRKFLKFASFETEEGRTAHTLIEDPKALQEKNKHKEKTPKERAALKKKIDQIMEDTYDGRKKRFIERREKILKDLSEEELYFKFDETTSDKLKRLKEIDIKESKIKAKNMKDDKNS